MALTLRFLLLAVVISACLGDGGENGTPWPETDFDFIVVGAGASGAVVASRLSEDQQYKVMLLEAGKEPPAFSKIPYFAPGPCNGETAWEDYITEPQTHACLALENQQYPWIRGKGLGGSTMINAMYFTRCNRKDYDIWAELGNEGWSYDDVLPYFIKLETYAAETTEETAKYHGKNGPMFASRPPYKTPIADAFLAGGKELGYETVDYNAGTQTGFDNPVFILKNGQRWSTYSAYLEPAKNRENLRIITKAFVTKVVINEKKEATGVIFEKDGKTWFVAAKKEVIVSAGAVSSPPLLLRSGIGPRKHLEKIGIPVVNDLPGVGQNLQDHICVDLVFSLEEPVATDTHRDTTVENLVLRETKGQGPMTMPSRGEGVSFMNSRYADPSEDFPDYELMMLSRPPWSFGIKQLQEAYGDIKDTRDLVTIYPIILRAKSLGYIELRSADPHEVPIFQPKYLTHNYDVEVLIEAIKGAVKLMETKAFQKYGAKLWMDGIPTPCKQLKEFSDEYWECYTRQKSFGLFHQTATCKMGPATDPMAVVDSRLRLYNITGLRVIDMSIPPTLVSGHTMIPSVMIGEKGAAMILQDWKTSKHRTEL